MEFLNDYNFTNYNSEQPLFLSSGARGRRSLGQRKTHFVLALALALFLLLLLVLVLVLVLFRFDYNFTNYNVTKTLRFVRAAPVAAGARGDGKRVSRDQISSM